MKRNWITGFLAAAMLLGSASCAGRDGGFPSGPVPEETPAPAASNTPAPEETASAKPSAPRKGKVLVAYFSATGNTRPLAEYAADILDADLYEIVPAQPYTADDLNYNKDCRANGEQNDDEARPAIDGAVEDMDQYDTVVIGYPIWWARAPKIIHTFLERYDLGGKTIVTFSTSGGSGHEDATIRGYEPDAVWLEGRRFAAGTGREAVAAWLETLELDGGREAAGSTLFLDVNGRRLTAALADNPSARALAELLAAGALTIEMSDYGGMEKVGPLGADLPRNDEPITTGPGDLILYQGNKLVLYYAANSWSLTRLGKVDGVTGQELREILGEGGVSLTVSLGE